MLRNQDPVHAAELIVGCAKTHPDVLKEPPPRVVFRKIGDLYETLWSRMAREYGVSRKSLWNICERRSWKHV